MNVLHKYIVFAILLSTSLVANAKTRNNITNDSVSTLTEGDSIKVSSYGLKSDYSNEYEKALMRKDYLTNRKKVLNDSIKIWEKELKRLESQHASIVRANVMLEEKIAQTKVMEQNSDAPELIKKRDQLIKTITAEEKEKASLDLQLRETKDRLDSQNIQKENLGRIKVNVANQIIAENKESLEKPFSKMNVDELRLIKSKCQRYSSDSKVNAFIAKVDVVIKNKELYDNMVNVVNASYKKVDVDRALASVSQIKVTNMVQQQEISELKTQMTLFPEGLAAFKEFITKLNEMRNGVNYSMEYFQIDSKQILSKNNLNNRIENLLKRVPYLNKKYGEFMNAIKAAPNKHSNVEIEILNQ